MVKTNVPVGLTNVVAIAGRRLPQPCVDWPRTAFLMSALPDRMTVLGRQCIQCISRRLRPGARPLRLPVATPWTNLAGETNAVLALTNVQPAEAGDYTVTVSNSLGSVTSRVARLTGVSAWFTVQPQAQTTWVGAKVVLAAEVRSSVPVAYQWRFNGVNLAGATNTTLELSTVGLEAAGAYSLVVSNRYGALASSEAVLSVSFVAAWGDNAQGQIAVPGGLTNVVAIALGAAIASRCGLTAQSPPGAATGMVKPMFQTD